LNFLRKCLSIILFKNYYFSKHIQSDAPFPKYSTSIMILLLAKIFAFFAKMQKKYFRFGPNGNWILTLPHKCLFPS
jgi:hypothetical protein